MDNIGKLCVALETYLAAAPGLNYVGAVNVALYNRENMPDFERCGLVISPVSESEKIVTVRSRGPQCKVDIACIVSLRGISQRDALLGSETERGIIGLVQDVKAALREFGQANEGALEIKYNETGEEVKYDSHPFPDRKHFYLEVILPYRVDLKPVTF